jgi:branched-chain amino acid transport system substrate-binding protein
VPSADNPLFFPTGTQAVMFDYGLVQEAKKAGVTKLGVLPCAEVAACSLGAKLFAGLTQIVGGIQRAYVQKITATQPSYTSVCLAAKAKGVNGLVIVENAATVLRASDQCAQQGYTPRGLNVSATTGQSWQDQPNMEGMITTQSNRSWLISRTRRCARFIRLSLNTHLTYRRASSTTRSTARSGRVAKRPKLAAERAKLAPGSTPADVLRGLYTFKNETVGGLTPPLTYVKDKPSLVPCWFTQQIKSGKFVPVTPGEKPHCISQGDLAKLQQLLAAL